LKTQFRATTDEAIKRGVFGSPFFFVDDEPFWGSDRLPLIDEWLERGGW
jgi:2-hydroxychromene-2-carboxylate isomerase